MNSIANASLSGYTSGAPKILFDTSAGDKPCTEYRVGNRDATNAVRVIVNDLHNAGEDGATVRPGTIVPFRNGLNGITKVVAWPEAGTPSIDAFVSRRD